VPDLEGGSSGAPSETGVSVVVVGAEAGTSSTSSQSEAEVEESSEVTSELATHSSNHSAKGTVSPSMCSGSRTFSRPVWTSLFQVGASKSSWSNRLDMTVEKCSSTTM